MFSLRLEPLFFERRRKQRGRKKRFIYVTPKEIPIGLKRIWESETGSPSSTYFIRLLSITLILENLFVVFLFLEGAWSYNLYFYFFWILRRCPLCTTWGSGVSVAPLILWVSQTQLFAESFVFPGINPIRFIRFFFWRLHSIFSGSSRVCLLGMPLVFFGVIS